MVEGYELQEFETPPHMLPCSCIAHLSLRSNTKSGAQGAAGVSARHGPKAACFALR